MASSTLHEKANGSRLSRLLVDKGTQALRRAFDEYVKYSPSGTLTGVLSANKTKLQALRYKVINSSQWWLLYPTSGAPDSNTFDVTLLTVVLRQICGLASPTAGWSTMPPDSDTSISANILRIKMFRNEVYAHVTTTEVDDNTFNRLWEEISKALIALGIPSREIDELKEAPLSPEEDGYICQLEEWKKEEDKLIEIALDTNATVKEILRIVKPRESKDVSDIDKLAKCDFRGKIRDLSASFHEGTRTWLFESLGSWFTDPNSKVMILTAGPGIGKSVFAAKVCDIYQKRGELAACHFCKFNNSDYRNPHTLLQSIASHMCDNVEGFKDKLVEQLRRSHCKETLSDAFRVLLNDPLYALEERDPMLIVIDAIDESEIEGKSELLELISEEFRNLPKWVKILITTRPELPVQEKLSHLNPLEIRSDNEDNEDDLFRYFKSCLSDTGASDDVLLFLVEQCQGSFLYAHYVQLESRGIKELTEDKLQNFAAKGIAGFYEKQFKRLKDCLSPLKIELKCLVNVLVASKAPLPLVLLRECLGLSKEADFELRKAVDDIMSSFLPVYDDCLTVYHKSLIDWLRSDGYSEHLFTADAKDGTSRLWCACEKLFIETTGLQDLTDLKLTPALRYALQHGMSHLVDVEDWNKLHWFVDLKLNYIKSCVFYKDSNYFDEYGNVSTNPENFPQIQCKYSRYAELNERRSGNVACKSYYLQCAANGCTSIYAEDDNDKKTAISVLKRGNYVWCEDFNITKHSSNRLCMSPVPIGPQCIGISPNGKLAVVGMFYSGSFAILQLRNLEVLFEYKSEITDGVRCCTFSPDSSLLLYGSLNSCFDVKAGEKISFFSGNSGQFVSCSFSLSGNRLVTADDTRFVKLWDVNQQIQLTSLDAGRPVNDCFFSKCGLFIVAKKNHGLNEYELIIWNALTWQRIDRRYFNLKLLLYFAFSPLSIQFFKASTQSEQNSELGSLLVAGNSIIFELPYGFPICLLSGFTECLTTRSGNRYFLLAYIKEKKSFIVFDPTERYVVAERRVQWLKSASSLSIVVVHGSIIVVDPVGFLVSFKIPNSPPFRSVCLFLCVPSSRFFPFWPAESVSSLFSPFFSVALSPFSHVTVICCSFSQDGLFLTTCDDQRIVRIWSVENCTVTQTWMFERPVMACWWSKTFLWFVFYTNIAKIPVTAKKEVTFSEIKRMYFNTRDLNVQSLSFSEGVLILKYSGLNVIGVFRIIDGNITVLPIIFPTTHMFDSASVGPGGCNILLASASKYQVYLWKETQLNSHELCLLIDRNVHLSDEDIGVLDFLQRAQAYSGRFCSECRITSDGLLGVIVIFSLHPFHTQFLKCVVISLTTGDIFRRFSTTSSDYFTSFKLTFYAGSSFLVFQCQNAVYILKLQDGEIVALWSKEGMSIESRSVFGFSSRHNLLAIPQSDGYFNFIKLHGLE